LIKPFPTTLLHPSTTPEKKANIMKRELEHESLTEPPIDSGEGKADDDEAPAKKHRAENDEVNVEVADEGECKQMETVAIKEEEKDGNGEAGANLPEATAAENSDVVMEEPTDDKLPNDETDAVSDPVSKGEPTSDKAEEENTTPKPVSKEELTSDKPEEENTTPEEESKGGDITNIESQHVQEADAVADAASKEDAIDVHGTNGSQERSESETLQESVGIDEEDKKEASAGVPTDEERKDSDETQQETDNHEGEGTPQETKEEKIEDGSDEVKESLDTNPPDSVATLNGSDEVKESLDTNPPDSVAALNGSDEVKESLDTNPPDSDAALKKGPNNSTSRSSAGRRLTFPEKLMELLNNEEHRECMSWLPNGNAFALQPTMFTKEILPKHFEGTKFESFTRKLNRWGFKRIAGEDTPEETFAYSHHLFKRDFPELCRGMSGGKKMEQDFTHLIRYRERERMINASTVAPGSLPNMGYGGMAGASGMGMQQGMVQADLQRMLLERQIAAAGGMVGNPYGNFGGGFERELALREMLLRQEAASGQNPNAAYFQQQHFAARFGQPPGPGQMQMNQMQLSQMGSGGHMMMGQGGATGASQGPGPGSFDATMMAGGGGGMANGQGGAGTPMSGAPAAPTASQQQQQNNADLMMMQEQRFRIQQQMAMQNAGNPSSANPAFASGAGGGGRPFGMQ
jgi:HSF-type DNA-binding